MRLTFVQLPGFSGLPMATVSVTGVAPDLRLPSFTHCIARSARPAPSRRIHAEAWYAPEAPISKSSA